MIFLNLLLASLVGFPLVVFSSVFVAYMYVVYLHYEHVKFSHVPEPKRKRCSIVLVWARQSGRFFIMLIYEGYNISHQGALKPPTQHICSVIPIAWPAQTRSSAPIVPWVHRKISLPGFSALLAWDSENSTRQCPPAVQPTDDLNFFSFFLHCTFLLLILLFKSVKGFVIIKWGWGFSCIIRKVGAVMPKKLLKLVNKWIFL